MSESASLLGSSGRPAYGAATADGTAKSGLPSEQPDGDGRTNKMGTFYGVFVPTTLNVLSILMFLRFGFIIGQAGILGTLGLLAVSYLLDLLTTLSISAISTNGTVRGGGTYYMISRSLGPEFGGSIGLIFYVGQVLNAGLNIVGFCDPLLASFPGLPDSAGFQFLYSTLVLLVVTGICLIGTGAVSRSAVVLLAILLTSTLSIPASLLVPREIHHPSYDLDHVGVSWNNLVNNLFPNFTKHAAGSQISGRESFRDLFGILFPATAGIFAGASMSGDLKNPSKSIPRGTLTGLLLTFVCYLLVVVFMGAGIPREILYVDVQVIQNVSYSRGLILAGEFATSLFSAIMGIVGAAKLLQAIARDNILPGLEIFSKGTAKSDDSIECILVSYLLTQVTILFDINMIATFITMAFLLTFLVTNLACFLLKISSAPNFRPSFVYFSWKTAFFAGIGCIAAMLIVDIAATCIISIITIGLFVFIHYVCPPKQWGDVSQALIYHQVRKYLLLLKQDNVKYWRPQILLLVDNPRTAWGLMKFCNYLKKGGLYIIGHVVVVQNFQESYGELKKQQQSWTKLRDVSDIKAFVQIAAGKDLAWGVRNVYLGSGLGGMKPNITVLGFYELEKHSSGNSSASKKALAKGRALPTDDCKQEETVGVSTWVEVLEDLLVMQSNIAVAKGFEHLDLARVEPEENRRSKRRFLREIKAPKPAKLDAEALHTPPPAEQFIDLYPIQMAAAIIDQTGAMSTMTTNFDTYALILQLGAILHTVEKWKKTHALRVIVFVETAEEVEQERSRLAYLLENLRIKAKVLVLCLQDGQFPTYNAVVRGQGEPPARVQESLKQEEWWQELQRARQHGRPAEDSAGPEDVPVRFLRRASTAWASPDGPTLHDAAAVSRRMSYGNSRGLSMSMRAGTLPILHLDDGSHSYDSSDESSVVSSEASEFSLPVRPAGVLGRPGWDSEMQGQLGDSAGHRMPSGGSRDSKTSGSRSSVYGGSQIASGTAAPRLGRSNSSLNVRNWKKPNFTSQTIPQTRVVLDAEGGNPSIMFGETDTGNNRKSGSGKRPQSGLSKTGSYIDDTASLKAIKSTNSVAPSEESSVVKTKDVEPEIESGGAEGEKKGDESELMVGEDELTFNDVPAKVQHLILNEMMQHVSGSATVIFSTLPAPSLGTHKSYEASLEYVKTLDAWCEGLPPLLLINSQTVTVTTAL